MIASYFMDMAIIAYFFWICTLFRKVSDEDEIWVS